MEGDGYYEDEDLDEYEKDSGENNESRARESNCMVSDNEDESCQLEYSKMRLDSLKVKKKGKKKPGRNNENKIKKKEIDSKKDEVGKDEFEDTGNNCADGFDDEQKLNESLQTIKDLKTKYKKKNTKKIKRDRYGGENLKRKNGSEDEDTEKENRETGKDDFFEDVVEDDELQETKLGSSGKIGVWEQASDENFEEDLTWNPHEDESARKSKEGSEFDDFELEGNQEMGEQIGLENDEKVEERRAKLNKLVYKKKKNKKDKKGKEKDSEDYYEEREEIEKKDVRHKEIGEEVEENFKAKQAQDEEKARKDDYAEVGDEEYEKRKEKLHKLKFKKKKRRVKENVIVSEAGEDEYMEIEDVDEEEVKHVAKEESGDRVVEVTEEDDEEMKEQEEEFTEEERGECRKTEEDIIEEEIVRDEEGEEDRDEKEEATEQEELNIKERKTDKAEEEREVEKVEELEEVGEESELRENDDHVREQEEWREEFKEEDVLSEEELLRENQVEDEREGKKETGEDDEEVEETGEEEEKHKEVRETERKTMIENEDDEEIYNRGSIIDEDDSAEEEMIETRKRLEDLKVGKKRRKQKRKGTAQFSDNDCSVYLEEGESEAFEKSKTDLENGGQSKEQPCTESYKEMLPDTQGESDNITNEFTKEQYESNSREPGNEAVIDDVDADAQNDDTSVYLSMTSLDARTEENESDYHSVTSFNVGSLENLDIVTDLQNVTMALNEFSRQGDKETRLPENEAEKSEDDYMTADEVAKETDADEEEYATAQEDDRSTIVGAEEEFVMENYETAEEKKEGSKIEQDEVVKNEEDLAELKKKDAEILQEADNVECDENGIDDEDNTTDRITSSSLYENHVTDELQIEEDVKPRQKRKKSLYSTIMAKKETKIKLRVTEFSAREAKAKEEITKAMARIAEAKSRLPLMIVEKRIPRIEAGEKLQTRLNGLEDRLEALTIYNKRTHDYIQNWRELEGEVRQKRSEYEMKRRKTIEKQKLLGQCKKRRMFLETEIMRHDDKQMAAKRRIKTLTDKKDMLLLRQKERRNIVNRCIESAKKHCELCIRKAAQVVAMTRRYEELKAREKFLEDEIFKKKKSLENMRKKVSCKKFDLERGQIQKSVKAMKKERGW